MIPVDLDTLTEKKLLELGDDAFDMYCARLMMRRDHDVFQQRIDEALARIQYRPWMEAA